MIEDNLTYCIHYIMFIVYIINKLLIVYTHINLVRNRVAP